MRSMEVHEALLAAEYIDPKDDKKVGGRPSASVGLEKTKARNSLTLAMQKQTDTSEKIESDAKELIEQLQANVLAAGGTYKGEVEMLIEEVKATKKLALDQVLAHRDDVLVDLESRLGVVDTACGAQAIQKAVKHGMTPSSIAHVKAFRGLKAKTANFLRVTAKAARTTAKQPADDAQADIDSPTNPFWEVVRNLDVANVATSVYEAKTGVRAAVITTQAAEDLSDTLAKNKTIKMHIKKATQTMLSTGNPCVGSPIDPGTPKCKVIMKIIGKALDKVYSTQHVLPDLPWAHKVACPELITIDERKSKSTKICSSHFASVEVRLYLEDDDVIMGLPFDKVQGATFREKQLYLRSLSIDAMKTLIGSASGFLMKPQAGELVVMPTGFVYASATIQTTFVRWMVSSDMDDNRRVMTMLELLTEEFSEFRQPSTGHTQFLEHLQAFS